MKHGTEWSRVEPLDVGTQISGKRGPGGDCRYKMVLGNMSEKKIIKMYYSWVRQLVVTYVKMDHLTGNITEGR